MAERIEHVENIGEPGARRRRRGALVWTAIAGVYAIVLVVTDAPSFFRLLFGIPAAFAAGGFLEAREKT